MTVITVHPYHPGDINEWNNWVATSRNGTFLHDRRFMDYHADRFHDASVMVRRDGKLIAVLPANIAGDTIISHGGLTYGGLITGPEMRTAMCIEVFVALLDHARARGARRLTYKPTPHIYHTQPTEEDLYALYRCEARLVRCDASASIPLARRLKMSKSRQQAVRTATKAGVEVRESNDWVAFWSVLAEVLRHRHGARPTHSLEEIVLLAGRFPDRIRLFGAFDGARMIAGVVTFDCGRTIHVQYIAASSAGREAGGVDIIVFHLIEKIFADRGWFDFGISTTDHGHSLNEGLAQQKEMFGARCIVYQEFEVLL